MKTDVNLDLFESASKAIHPATKAQRKLAAVHMGEVLRDEGIKRAVDHANATSPDWSEQAFNVVVWLAHQGGDFTAEDARARAQELGLPPAPNAKAWGGPFAAAAKRGLIRRVGYAPGQLAQCHRAPKAVWRKA